MNKVTLGTLVVVALGLFALNVFHAPAWALVLGLVIAIAALVSAIALSRKTQAGRGESATPKAESATSSPAQRSVNLYNRILLPLGGMVLTIGGVGLAVFHLTNDAQRADPGWIIVTIIGAVLFCACVVFLVFMRRSAIRRTGHWV